MNITINEELRSFVDPLTAVEYAALERSLLAEGCRDALVLWNDTLIDGHNRYEICKKHGIEFKTVQNTRFSSIEDVMLWMIDNHLARRSVSDYQRGMLALRKKDIITARTAAQQPPEKAAAPEAEADRPAEPPRPVIKREELAREARVSPNIIGQLERIRKAATPQLVEAVRQGTISINAAANVASLPEAVQIAAVAGGRKELQQMARQVREQKMASRPPREPRPDAEAAAEGTQPPPWQDAQQDEVASLRAQVAALKQRVTELTAENAALKDQLQAR